MNSNIKLDTITKLGPFLHQGGWIALSIPYYELGVITMTPTNHHGFDLEAGWFFRHRDQNGIVIIRGNNNDSGPIKDEKTAFKAYERWNQRTKWQIIWRDAVKNMPYREGRKEMVRWVPQEKGTVPLPEFVKGNAFDEMRVHDGIIDIKETFYIKYGQISLLCLLMGYTYTDKASNKIRLDTNGFYHVRTGGMKPRDVEKQKLALRFASGEGNALAWQKLREMGKDHLYTK